MALELAISLLVLLGCLAPIFGTVYFGKQCALERGLRKGGTVKVAQTVSAETKAGSRGRISTSISYSFTAEDRPIAGSVTYSTGKSDRVRRPRPGEDIPVLYLSPDAHRPL